VAYAKLGRPEEGIAILEQSLAKQPDRYETLSNLGTLHFFAGHLDLSKDYIRRALAINPNAHFGREKYQLLLTEYVEQSQRGELGVLSSEYRTPSEEGVILVGFADFVLRHSESGRDEFPQRLRAAQREEIRAAVRGVLGMLHFADHTSPILLECLGDLLLTGRLSDDAAQHAARAYLRAAEFAPNPDAAARLRVMAKESLSVQEKVYFTPLRESLAAEIAAADQWFADISASEARWIREGQDVDRQFAAAYYQTLEQVMATSMAESRQPERTSWYETFRGQVDRGQYLSLAFAFILAPLVAFAATFLGVYWLRTRNQRGATSTKKQPRVKAVK
jgi:tetratricopeptide (TPR) repeat protein